MIIDSNLAALDYDDVLLLPQRTSIESRDDVVIYDSNPYITYPIFMSPMKNISEPEMVIRIAELGGVGILHRFFTNEDDRYDAVSKISTSLDKFTHSFGVAVGVKNIHHEIDFAEHSINMGASFVCVDAANGYMDKIVRVVDELNFLKSKYPKFYIISGNVVDAIGVSSLAKAGSDYVRVGIGGGSLCSTRNFTGIGCPMLTAIEESALAKQNYPVKIIADGGIRSSGEAMKAFAFGADAVMVGGLFGRAIEANNGGVIYGMSSAKLQSEMGKEIKSNEGLVKQIPQSDLRPISEIFNEFLYGIKSGLSYLNCRSLQELKTSPVHYIRTGSGTLKNL